MKRAISIIMTVVLVLSLSLVGCGDEGKSVKTRTFKIGGIGPLHGESAFYGQEVYNGMKLAIDEINNKGGIAGEHVELNFIDDMADPGKALEAYEELKEWGVHVIAGATTSDSCIALASETEKDKIFQITPSSSAVNSVNHYNVFQVCFSDPNQGAAAAEYIFEKNLGERVAVVYDTSSSYSTGIFRGFSEKAHEIGLEMVAIKGFDSESNSDFTEPLKEIKKMDADIVFLPVYYKQASIILQQAHDMNYSPKFLGCDGIEGVLEVDGMEPEVAEGVMYLTPFVAGELAPRAQVFANRYETLYGSKPSQFAADAYDAIYIIKQAAEESGIEINMANKQICNSMIGAMIHMQFEGITAPKRSVMSWDENGMVNKEPKVAVIQDGQYQLVEE